MSKFFDEKMNTFNNIDEVLSEEDNKQIIAGFTPLEDLIVEFRADAAQLGANFMIIFGAKGKVDVNKTPKFDLLTTLTVRLARKALAWAIKNQDAEAIKTYDIHKSDFKMSAANRVTLGETVAKQLETNLNQLTPYRVTKANLDALQAAILEAKKYSSEPKTKIIKGAEANRANHALVRKIDETLDGMEDLIVSEFEESHLKFVNIFLAARHINNLGSRKTKLLITVVDKNEKPVADAYVDVLEMENEEKYTDENGEAPIAGIKSGAHIVEVSKDGAKTDTKFTIKLGEQLRLKVVL